MEKRNVAKIEDLRAQIDEIDENMVQLLNKRFAICMELSKVKKKSGFSTIDLIRQREILKRVKLLSCSEFKNANYSIFSHIMQVSAKLQDDFKCNF